MKKPLKFRPAQTTLEKEFLEQAVALSMIIYEQPWHPRASEVLWEKAFINGFAPYLYNTGKITGCWMEWSLRHGELRLVDPYEWIQHHPHLAYDDEIG